MKTHPAQAASHSLVRSLELDQRATEWLILTSLMVVCYMLDVVIRLVAQVPSNLLAFNLGVDIRDRTLVALLASTCFALFALRRIRPQSARACALVSEPTKK